MDLLGSFKPFAERYVFKVIEIDKEGLVSGKSESLSYGIAVWKRGGKVHWVVMYPILMVISAITLLCMVVHHILDFKRTTWSTMLFEYIHPITALMYTSTFWRQREKIYRVSCALDKWWHYTYLEKELEDLKRSAANKVNKFNYVYYNSMMLGGIIYCLQPVYRCYYNADANNLLMFQIWTPFLQSTWWGFSVTFILEVVSTVTAFTSFGSIVSYLMTAVMTIGNQLQLISTSLVTVDRRVRRVMRETGVLEDQDWAVARTRIIQKELRNSTIHFQTINSLAEEVCEFFTAPINLVYYPVMCVLVVWCGKLSTERDNKFLLLQVTIMALALLISQYLVVYINQILTDQMENLRFAVYDSSWYSMQVPCRKTIHIMQLMVLKKPNIKTMLGANADMEFFATVCNASYFYISALASMNTEHPDVLPELLSPCFIYNT